MMPELALQDVLPESSVTLFIPDDLAELVVLQRCCWVSEAIVNATLDIPPLHESADDVLQWAMSWTTLIVRARHRLVAAVRAKPVGEDWEIGRLMVAPDMAGQGLGSALLRLIESMAPDSSSRAVLFTGVHSDRNIRTYVRAGYSPTGEDSAAGIVYLTKVLHRSS